MKNKSTELVCLLCLSLVILASLGCIQTGEQPGPTQNESRYVPLGDAKSANVNVAMGAGMLTLEGGAGTKNLMDANFIYNTASWKPDVNYSVSRGVGDLQVLQPDSGGVYLAGVVRNDWNLRLNDVVPINLIVNLGAGEGALRFGGLSLTGLEVKSGAGKLTADFDGIWKNDLNVSIDSGVGELAIVLPQNTGVMVNVSQGIGTTEVGSGLKADGGYYINDAYGKSGTTLRISVKSGVGKTKLSLAP